MLWLKHHVEYYRKNAIKQHAYRKVAPNFRSHFKDLPPNRSKMLDKISTESKAKTTEAIIEKFNTSTFEINKKPDPVENDELPIFEVL